MSNETLPELKQIVGALVFGANRSLSLRELRRCIVEVAEQSEGLWAAYVDVKDSDIRQAVRELHEAVARSKSGFILSEVAGGWRFQSDSVCGAWLKHLLNIGRPSRLSGPALETLAIVAYRQPISRVDIEAIRGVNVDHVVRMLMEMQLVRIAGRSELPGKPFLYGTTQKFLEHFGLKGLDDLKDLEPGLLASRQGGKGKSSGSKAKADEAGGVAGESGLSEHEEAHELEVGEEDELAEETDFPEDKADGSDGEADFDDD